MIAPYWKPWFGRRGKIKGIAIVFRCSDIGLELHSGLAEEHDRVQLCEQLCDKLNHAEGRPPSPFSTHLERAMDEIAKQQTFRVNASLMTDQKLNTEGR